MKAFRIFLVGLFLSISTSLAAPLPQRVLYIGHRSSAFEPLLKEHFAEVKSAAREQFQPAQAKDFDVVVLDWPQSGERHGAWVNGAPLGQRHDWHKPTVLIGSAGLNLAVAWKLKGGSGCTCLAPVAYNLRYHPIFQSPIKINIRATTNIPTPHTFSDELKVPTVEVLPLVDHIKHFETVLKDYRAGWSTHYYEFADMPEVEVFSGALLELNSDWNLIPIDVELGQIGRAFPSGGNMNGFGDHARRCGRHVRVQPGSCGAKGDGYASDDDGNESQRPAILRRVYGPRKAKRISRR